VRETRFELLRHLVMVPVVLNGAERRFILDSGIGLTLVRAGIEGCVPTGSTFTGKRMSGQEVTIPLATALSLAFAGIEARDTEVGLLNMSGFPPELAQIDGFLSLGFFRRQPFTVNYQQAAIGDGRDTTGARVPLRVELEGPAVTAFTALTIPGGRTIEVELDMGSDVLILDEGFAAETGVQLDATDARQEEGVDETGNPYLRTFTRLKGSIQPAGAPDLAHNNPDVMFQRIIHDGLLGHAYLSRYTVTWDIPTSEIRLQQP
jgi:hypothetical protein